MTRLNAWLGVATGLCFTVAAAYHIALGGFQLWYLIPYLSTVVISVGITWGVAKSYPAEILSVWKLIGILFATTVLTILLSGQVAAFTASVLGLIDLGTVPAIGLVASAAFTADVWPVLVPALVISSVIANTLSRRNDGIRMLTGAVAAVVLLIPSMLPVFAWGATLNFEVAFAAVVTCIGVAIWAPKARWVTAIGASLLIAIPPFPYWTYSIDQLPWGRFILVYGVAMLLFAVIFWAITGRQPSAALETNQH